MIAALAALAALVASRGEIQGSGLAAPQAAGKTWFYLTMWPDQFAKFDPETDAIVKSLKNRHGTGYDLTLSWDQKRVFQITGQRSFVEIVDLATMEVVDEHSFERDGFIVRVQDVKEIPGGEKWYLRVEEVEKKLDSYVVKEAEWVEYVLAERKLGKRMKDLPRPIRSGARVSPDGTKWHVFGRDLTVVDPKTLKEEGKVELSKPQYWGMGPISIRGEDLFDRRNPAAYRFLYTMRDPVNKNRSLAGLVDLDMQGLKIAKLVEWGAAPRIGGWYWSRDQRVAVGQARGGERRSQADGRDPEITLYSMDLATGRKIKETRVEVRNGLRIAGLSPDGSKIYLAGRGEELVVYDQDHQYVKTITLPGDFDGSILAVDG